MRTLSRTALTNAALAMFMVGCSAESAGEKRLELEGSSWDAALAIQVTKAPQRGVAAECASVSLNLHIEESAGVPSLLLGRDGLAHRTPVRATEHGYELVESHVDVPVEGGCLGRDRLALSNLSLRGVDTDADGVADTLRGDGVGRGSTLVGDTIDSYDVAFSLTGEVDTTNPVILPPPAELSPLYGLAVVASEPLPSGSTLSLEGTSDVTLTPRIDDAVGAITAFFSEQVLPFGGTWTTVATASDFADNALTQRTEFRTVADPGVFAQDGFESEVFASPAPAVQVVEGIGVVRAISGQRSLWVTSQTVMLHLKRAPGQTKLRARAQWFYPSDRIGPAPTILVGVVGSARRSLDETNSEPPTLLSEEARYGNATPVRELTLPLEGDGEDVIVGIRGALPSCYFGVDCRQPGGVLLDELRLE